VTSTSISVDYDSELTPCALGQAFGLGEKTGIGLPVRAPGWFQHPGGKNRHWAFRGKKEKPSIAIGQGFDSATPLQMALAYAAIANNGRLWQPYVVRRIEGHGPDEVDEIGGKLKGKIPIEQRYFDVVKKGLLGVVESPQGTAHCYQRQSVSHCR